MSSHILASSSQIRKLRTIRKADFRIENHGSICLVHPLNASGRAWMEENIGATNGFQPYFPTVVIEPRYLADILAGIRADRLVAR